VNSSRIQSYVEDLGAVSKDALDRAGTRVVVIGCGEASVIAVYKGVSHSDLTNRV